MIKCTNLTKDKIEEISGFVAKAFLSEPGCFTVLSIESASKMFYHIIDECYKAGHLYATSKNLEGVCVYWTKETRPDAIAQLKIGWHMLRSLTLKELISLGKDQSNWTETEKRYKREENFVEIFLIAIRPECQGRGWFRKMISEPFELSKNLGCSCVLDTDAEDKVSKYQHVGMKLVDRRKAKDGTEMFAMEYRAR